MASTTPIALSAEQAAKLIGVNRATIYRMLKDGRLHDLSLSTIIAYARERAFQEGRRSMLEELRRGGCIRRRGHHLRRLAHLTTKPQTDAEGGAAVSPSPPYPPSPLGNT